MKDATISVNRCLWSPDGCVIGTDESKCFSYLMIFYFIDGFLTS